VFFRSPKSNVFYWTYVSLAIGYFFYVFGSVNSVHCFGVLIDCETYVEKSDI
jgi:hypothetical protein